MVSKPLRILTFIFSAFLVLAFTVGVTQAANKVFFASVGGAAGKNVSAVYPDPSATADPSQTPEPSMTPEPSQTSESKVEFSGVITAIDLEWWTIGDYVVQVTADTEFEGDPVVGDFVSVEAFLQPDGSYIAHEISKDDGSMEEDSEENVHLTSTPGHDDSNDDDHEEYSSTPEMHDDEQEGDDGQHEENGSGSSEDDHEHGGGSGDHDGSGSGDHGGGGDD